MRKLRCWLRPHDWTDWEMRVTRIKSARKTIEYRHCRRCGDEEQRP